MWNSRSCRETELFLTNRASSDTTDPAEMMQDPEKIEEEMGELLDDDNPFF